MAIDDRHEIEPHTGFAVDKDSGHIVGLMQAPVARVAPDIEFPAWVAPHQSRIQVKKTEGAPDHVSVDGFSDIHVNRVDGAVTVLVKDAEEAERALAGPSHRDLDDVMGGKPTPLGDDRLLREVHTDVERAKRDEAEKLNRQIKADQDALERDEAARRAVENSKLTAAELEAAEQLAADERARAAVIAQS